MAPFDIQPNQSSSLRAVFAMDLRVYPARANLAKRAKLNGHAFLADTLARIPTRGYEIGAAVCAVGRVWMIMVATSSKRCRQ